MGNAREVFGEHAGAEDGFGVTAVKVCIGRLEFEDDLLDGLAYDDGLYDEEPYDEDPRGEDFGDGDACGGGADGRGTPMRFGMSDGRPVGMCCLGVGVLGVEWPTDARDPRKLGKLGEELATRYLTVRGYEILERNRRTPFGEADLVCRDGDETVLVEVKTRFGDTAFPEEAVDEDKVRRYRKITLDYLGKNEDCDSVRFDVVAINVLSHERARVNHYVGVCAWEG